IPFGLALAPRVFSKFVEAALTPLRNGGVRVSSYLDDLLICAPSPWQAESDTYTLVTHLERLGFKINQTKSWLTPSQEIVYLGLRLNSVMFRAFLSEERIKTFHSCLSLFQNGRLVSFRMCLRLLGLMASTMSVVSLGLLRMRDFQIWTASQGIRPKSRLSRRVRVTPECMSALSLESPVFLLSRGNLLYREWRLHPQVIHMVWQRFGRAAIDLFASCEDVQYPVFFSLAGDDAPLGVDALAHEWPDVLLYTFPPLIESTLRRVRQYKHVMILIAPYWPGRL
ncbi:uncharacterized protein LOC107708749, partial [Sinocyclocheilus rhinocerous]|uniref:uncharacterized protein LOC107708749 n=1 Tax=Sinocyclocheilus rhinocerous TaxID=307959 RepID=UPI0007B88FFF